MKREQVFTIYLKDKDATLESIVEKIELHKDIPEYIVDALRASPRTLDLLHKNQVCKLFEDHRLSDYLIRPLTSRKAPGKTKKSQQQRFEQAVLDLSPPLVQNPMVQQYSPRTKISMMSRLEHGHDHDIEKSMQGIHQVAVKDEKRRKSGVDWKQLGSGAEIELVGMKTNEPFNFDSAAAAPPEERIPQPRVQIKKRSLPMSSSNSDNVQVATPVATAECVLQMEH